MKMILTLIWVTLLPLVTNAYDVVVDGIYYNLSDDCASVTSGDSQYSGCIEIPSFIKYESLTYSVTSIGEKAFYDCSELTSVTVPESVTSVDNDAFYNCSSLTNVEFKGDSVHFGSRVFGSCSSLKSIELPAGDEVVANYMFVRCTNLETLTIPEGYKRLGNAIFGNYGFYRPIVQSLSTLSLPTTMESLDNLPSEVVRGLTTLYITPELLRSFVGESDAQWRNLCSNYYGKCPNLTDLYVRASSIQDICENGVLNNDYGGGWTDAHAHLLIDGEEVNDLQIPMGVDTLAEAAFAFMGFETVSIPSSLTSLSSGAFLQCWNLKEVVVPGSVKTIGVGAFSRCYNLEKATLEEGVEVMDIWTFDNTPLKEIHLPSSLQKIGNNDFSSCSNLTSIAIPEGVTDIGSSAFSNCNSLAEVFCYAKQFPSASAAFSDTPIANATLHVPLCFLNKYITESPWSGFGTIIPLEESGDYAYIDGIYYTLSGNDAKVTLADDTYSGAVAIPESITFNDKTYIVKSIGDAAFYKCTGISSVTIPNSVTSIGSEAFSLCKNIATVTFGSGVNSVGDKAFYSCTGLEKVIVPDIAAWCNILFESSSSNPVYYAEHIFSDEDTEIIDLVIPDGVTSIGNRAFQYCSGISSVEIPNSVTSIGDYALVGTGLTSLTIPGSVTTIGENAFALCSSLTSIDVKEGNVNYDSRDNCNAIIETATNTLLTGCQSTFIPNGVTSIADDAFYNCRGLTSITIPESVTSIGEAAFYCCSGLTSIRIPESVTSIGEAAFYYCSGLTSITIGNGLANISDYAFYGCSSLTSVTIPNNVTSIGRYAFAYCTGLTSVTIPDNVTSIGSGAFRNCTGLTSVTFGNGVTSISDYLLYQCSSLTTVIIPKSVTNIGRYFLASCSSIADVYCFAESIPETDSYAFSYYGEKYISAATLHVPEVSIDLYKATKPWSDFGTIVPLKDEDAIEDVKANENALEADYFDIHGIKMAKPQKDIYIIRHSDGTTRKVLIK